MCNCHPNGHPRLRLKKGVSRREVIQMGLAGMGVMALGPLTGRMPSAFGAPAGNKLLVVLNLSGGNDFLNTVIPQIPAYTTVRTAINPLNSLVLPALSQVSLNSGPNATTAYNLHAALPKIKALWDEGAVSIINRVGYPDENQSHFTSQDIFSYAYRDAFPGGVPVSGWIARYADLYAPTPTGAVSVGFGRPKDFSGGTSNPLLLNSLGQFKFNTDPSYFNSNVQRANAVKSIVAGIPTGGLPSTVAADVGSAYDLASAVQNAATSYAANPGNPAYPNRGISNSMKDIATLIFGGFDTRIFYTGTGGYDTHSAQGIAVGSYHSNLLTDLDNAVGTFATDMKHQGQWNNVVIAIMTEFGRRNYPNGSAGLDHGHGYCMILVGGALAVQGTGGKKGVDLVANDLIGKETVPYAVDFRDVLRELVTDHLGASSATPVFPEPQPANGVWNVI